MAHCPRRDQILGLNEPISRRDFLDGMLMTSAAVAAGAACPFSLAAQGQTPTQGPATCRRLDWLLGRGRLRRSAGNTEQVLQGAHGVRDGKFDKEPTDFTETNEIYDCVVVGGGHAGLSAGMFFSKQADAKRTCLILDNAHIFGGVAKRNEFSVDGHTLYAPQASVHFQPPYPDSFLNTVYDMMGLDWDAFKTYQKWQGPSPEIKVPRSPYGEGSINGKEALGMYFGEKYGHKPGIWVTDPWGKNLEGTPFPDGAKSRHVAATRGKARSCRQIEYDFPGDAKFRATRQHDAGRLFLPHVRGQQGNRPADGRIRSGGRIRAWSRRALGVPPLRMVENYSDR